MDKLTKLKLRAVHIYCDDNDKSTEYMLQFMQDTCNVDLDTVMNYLELNEKQKDKLFYELEDFVELISMLE